MKEQLRNLKGTDSKMLFNWRNHPNTRKNSFDKGELSLADHQEWFKNILNDHNVITYILEIKQIPVGVIRFEIEGGEEAKINYLIDPSQQGKGFGTKILDLGVKKVFKVNIKLKKVYGSVLKDNSASIKIFKKLSFVKASEDTIELKFEKSIE